MSEPREKALPSVSSIINNRKFRQIAYQVIFVILIYLFVDWLVGNTIANLEKRNIKTGFDFLGSTASFAISQTLIDYSEIHSYARALLVGIINTLIVACLGIICATLLGFIIGVARLSNNVLVSSTAGTYIEIVRNIPLLLQIFFWYFAVLRLVPGARDKSSFLGDLFHLNIKGLYGPKPIFGDGSSLILIGLVLAIGIWIGIARWARQRQIATGQTFPTGWTGLALLIGLPLIAFFIAGMPISFEHPEFVETGPVFKRGFTLGVGMKLIPELMSLWIALTMYTAAFIAEIVRAGILAVNHGQTEAAYSLGLRPGKTLRLIIIPQAMRVIIPPLTNQYLNLTKNSSLAVAIAYPDLVSVGGIVISQSGQAIEVIAIWMAIYLSLSLTTSLFMNWFNSRMAIVER